MSTIAAANNLMIRMEDNRWSLFNGRGEDVPAIVEAGPEGLTYQQIFSTARRLSPDGHLPVDAISMIVLGWATEDSSWHLGLLLSQEIAQTRGGRWCGLARWENWDSDEAERAGQALARALGRPFRLVPPENRPAPAPVPEVVTAPVIEPVPLMPLPIVLDEWILEEDSVGLTWVRASTWRTKKVVQIVFSVILAIIFMALSLGARLSLYAPVQPDWLPLVGLGIGFLMILTAIGQIFSLSRSTHVLIDNRLRIVRVLRGARRIVVQSPYEGIENILISHVMHRREKNSDAEIEGYDHIWLETWIHLFSPRRGFISVCYANQVEGRLLSGVKVDERRPLNLGEIDTPAHHAAAIMGEMMDIPVFVEER
jgi:hypothetical protein